MDRAAKLAADARSFVAFENYLIGNGRNPAEVRVAIREGLEIAAVRHGYDPKTESSAAVDQALTDAGTTP